MRVHKSRYNKQDGDAPENLIREHCSPSGFSWSLRFPEHKAAAIGALKPRAQVLCEGYEPYGIPVRVAKAFEKQLSSGEIPEPESHAELLYDIRELSQKWALQRVVDMVSRREYSSTEATQRLIRDGYSKNAAEYAVSRALELGIINDKRFAESFVRSKLYAGWGPVRIERELVQKGIEPSSIEGWPYEYFEDQSVSENAYELVKTKRIPSKNAYQKLVRFLVTRGYSLSDAKTAVKRYLDEYEELLD